MPRLSLAVCVHDEASLLARLLQETNGLFDDLVVIHDGEDANNSCSELANQYGGRYFVRPREYQQEPHWPFAWENCRHDWILRLDADEFPSTEMKAWLEEFRAKEFVHDETSGYTCIWPLWNGHRPVTKRYPANRVFLVNRQRIRFIGMVEMSPMPDGRFEHVPLILHHQPARKSYGLANILIREQAYAWRRAIARSLQGPPVALKCWRWTDNNWPDTWRRITRKPLTEAMLRFIKYPVVTAIDMARQFEIPRPFFCLMPAIHHFLICIEFVRQRSVLSTNGQRRQE